LIEIPDFLVCVTSTWSVGQFWLDEENALKKCSYATKVIAKNNYKVFLFLSDRTLQPIKVAIFDFLVC